MRDFDVTRREFVRTAGIFAVAPVVLSICACTGGSGSSSSSKTRSEKCHICKKTFTDAENMKSIRYTNMCLKCNNTRETLNEVIENQSNEN